MLSVFACRIGAIVPRALQRIEEYRRLAQENEPRELERELSLPRPAVEEGEEKSRSEMRRRLAQFEGQLRRGNDKGRRLVRNKHVLLRTVAELPIEEAREAAARDPGLRLLGIAERGTARFVRWDAGCSSCGSAFELGANGKPTKAIDIPDGQLSLFGVEGSPFWDVLRDGEGNGLPQGLVRCPYCGRVSKLSLDASEVIVAFNWPTIAIEPCRVPFNRAGEAFGLSRRIFPEHLEMYFNFAKGRAWHGLANASKHGLRPDVVQRLDEYPIAEAVARLLCKNGIEIGGIQPDRPMPIDELIEAIGGA